MSQAGPVQDPDRYTLHALIMRGGEGELWKGSLIVDGTAVDVAVKVIHAQGEPSIETWQQRWNDQAEVLKSIHHPGVVTVRDVFGGPVPHAAGEADASSRSLFLVMSWVDGVNLENWVATHPGRSVQESALIIGKLAQAVSFLHSGPISGRAVLHRDIKPANVIVNGTDATLVDFGLARVLTGSPLTQTTGSPAYWAPEVALGGEYGEAADRFSLGATAYFVLTGQVPVLANPVQMRDALAAVPGVVEPGQFVDHVMSMLSFDPAARPVDVVSWANMLTVGALSGQFAAPGMTRISSHPHLPPPAPPAGATKKAGSGRKRLLVTIGIVGVVAIGAAVAVFALGGDGGSNAADTTSSAVEATIAASPALTTTPETDPPMNAAPAPTSAPTTTVAPTTTAAATTTTELPTVIMAASMIGDDASVLRADLEAAGVTVTVVEVESAKPVGTLLVMTPRSGTMSAGDTVELQIAIAPTIVPDVVGLSVSEAKSKLEALGITVSTVDQLDEVGAEGAVLSQDPAAGSPFVAAVNLAVADRGVITYVGDMTDIRGTRYSDQADISGQIYTRSVLMSTNGSQINAYEFDLGRVGLRLRGTFGLRDDSPSTYVAIVQIYGDGIELVNQQVMLGQAFPLDLDITNVLRLRVQVTRISDSGSALTAFGDLRVLGTDTLVPADG